jgi:hypothetical protein
MSSVCGIRRVRKTKSYCLYGMRKGDMWLHKELDSLDKESMAAMLSEIISGGVKVCMKMLDSIAALAADQLNMTGKFFIPYMVRMRAHTPRVPTARRMYVAGRVVWMKAKPAKVLVNVYISHLFKKMLRNTLCPD